MTYTQALAKLAAVVARLSRQPVKPKRKRAKRRASFMPPRAVEVPVEPVFAPSPVKPQPAPAQPSPVESSGVRWQRQCMAVDAVTGLRCGLVGQHDTHRTARGPFVTVAAPGQTHFARKAELERIAFADGGAVESLSHRATVREGKRAHAGHITADDRSVRHNRQAHGDAA